MRLLLIVYFKYLLSFFKKDWKLSDYPIQKWKDDDEFYIRIVNWYMMFQTGSSYEEAFERLNNDIKIYKLKKTLPRPGVKQKL